MDYTEKLNRVVDTARRMPGTAGARALKKIVMDLEGDGPIGELMFSLDKDHFDMVIDLLQEFRRTGRHEGFNSIHSAARDRIQEPVQMALAGERRNRIPKMQGA